MYVFKMFASPPLRRSCQKIYLVIKNFKKYILRNLMEIMHINYNYTPCLGGLFGVMSLLLINIRVVKIQHLNRKKMHSV